MSRAAIPSLSEDANSIITIEKDGNRNVTAINNEEDDENNLAPSEDNKKSLQRLVTLSLVIAFYFVSSLYNSLFAPFFPGEVGNI